MDRRNALIIALVIIVMVLTATTTVFFHEIRPVKEAVGVDLSREQPSIGGKVSINVLNNEGNATNATIT